MTLALLASDGAPDKKTGEGQSYLPCFIAFPLRLTKHQNKFFVQFWESSKQRYGFCPSSISLSAQQFTLFSVPWPSPCVWSSRQRCCCEVCRRDKCPSSIQIFALECRDGFSFWNRSSTDMHPSHLSKVYCWHCLLRVSVSWTA